MKKVMLVCNAGMSTGILAKRIEQASEGQLFVRAYGEAEYLEYVQDYDLILLGPQIRHLKPEVQANVHIPVESIAPQYYGVMNGAGVYKDIMKILGL